MIQSKNLNDQLQRLGIQLNKNIIMMQYGQCFNMMQVIHSIVMRYEEAFKKISPKKLIPIFDEWIQEVYDTKEILDAYYIYQEILACQKSRQLEELKHLTTRMIGMNDLYHNNRLIPYFEEIDEHIDITLYKVFSHVHINKKDPKQVNMFIDLLDQYMKAFDQDQAFTKEVALLRLEHMALLQDTDRIDQTIIDIKKNYYVSSYSVYAKVLLGLEASKADPKLFDQYYQRAIQYTLFNEEDYEKRDFIDTMYKEYVQHKKAS